MASPAPTGGAADQPGTPTDAIQASRVRNALARLLEYPKTAVPAPVMDGVAAAALKQWEIDHDASREGMLNSEAVYEERVREAVQHYGRTRFVTRWNDQTKQWEPVWQWNANTMQWQAV